MSNFRIGNGFDVHLLAEGLPFVLGGITVEHTRGCVAHSDGDVAIHSLCDALLGALGLGDIGKYFPDSDPSFKAIDSKILLERTYRMIVDRGWRLVNADITILLQRPKIAPYIEKMQRSLDSVFNSVDGGENNDSITRCAVKATTTEKAGFVGREEGIAAYASVLIEKKFA